MMFEVKKTLLSPFGVTKDRFKVFYWDVALK